MDGVHRVVHGGVVTHEVDDLIRVILGGLHVGGEGSSRTLRKYRVGVSKELACKFTVALFSGNSTFG